MDGCREIAAAYNLLPNALLVLGGDALFPAFLNSGQDVLEGIHLPAGPLLTLWNPAISFRPRWQDSFSHSYFVVAKAVANQKYAVVFSVVMTRYET